MKKKNLGYKIKKSVKLEGNLNTPAWGHNVIYKGSNIVKVTKHTVTLQSPVTSFITDGFTIIEEETFQQSMKFKKEQLEEINLDTYRCYYCQEQNTSPCASAHNSQNCGVYPKIETKGYTYA